jgi:predicted ABC-type ATPase
LRSSAPREAGYFVRFFFVCTDDPEINVRRVFARSLEGGHEVPMGKIVSRFAKSIAQCAAIVRVVDRAYVYDNSVDRRKPSLLFRAVNGNLINSYGEMRPWAEPILSRLANA